MSKKVLAIRQPDDFHVHLRDGEQLIWVLPFTCLFGRAVAMGNLARSVTTAEDVNDYRQWILKFSEHGFKPIMSVMLTARTTPQILEQAAAAGARVLKFIPGSTSTNSADGIGLLNLKDYYHVLEAAERLGLILAGHWELLKGPGAEAPLPEPEREEMALFTLRQIINDFPKLKITAEHASTEALIELVAKSPPNVAATLTVHHALLTSEDVLDEPGQIKNPLLYCKPIPKSTADREAVIQAMTSGNPKFFFGSDSAPHPVIKKRAEPPAAGIFTAPVALPLLAEIFEKQNALNRLEDFVSRFGAEFYGLPLNEGQITLKRQSWKVPDSHRGIPVFWGNKRIKWQVSRLRLN